MADQAIKGHPTNRWRCLALFLLALLLVLLCIIVYLTTLVKQRADDILSAQPLGQGTVQLGEPDQPSVFHDLTRSEIQGLVHFLANEKTLNITRSPSITVDSNYRYLAELYIPPKDEVLRHLDDNGPQPEREAKVTIFRGAIDIPDVIERIVGPLPNPTYLKPIPGRPHSVPFIRRPINIPEYDKIVEYVENAVYNELDYFLQSVYGGRLKNCGHECLAMAYFSQMSPVVSGEYTRKFWMWLSRIREYYLLNTLDFAVLVNSLNDLEIEAVWFRGTTYKTLENLKLANIVNITHPDSMSDGFSKATRRGKPFWDLPLRNPTLHDPDGRRYSVSYNHITYMRWAFDFRMSSAYGPQLYDLRYGDQRIIYELGLQELCVFYSANNPAQMFADFFDSSDLIGPKASPLVPGVDCPSHATFIDSMFLTETSDEPFSTKNVFCVFELNTGDPHRRHYNYESGVSFDYESDVSYEGMESVLLVFRTILTIMNYDYVFDFRFFQNGALQVRVVSTGFISTSFYRQEEYLYGYRIQEFITGNLHHHLMHFKVDLDVMGTKNRFATLDIEQDTVDNHWSKIHGHKYHQTKFSHNLKETELQAAYKFDFNSPKYLTFYNNKSTNRYGVPKSYRVLMRGMTKSLLAEGQGNEPAASWSRYQMAVTRRKEEEAYSSSQYAAFDSDDPVVQFQHFLEDDEGILDEDLVAWITLGMHHIPHTEDLPVTPTPGMDVSFLLLPFNYFPEDAAIASRNAVRIERKNKLRPDEGVTVERYGVKQESGCALNDNSFWRDVERDPAILFGDHE